MTTPVRRELFNFDLLQPAQQKLAKEAAAYIQERIDSSSRAIIEIGARLNELHRSLRDEHLFEFAKITFGFSRQQVWAFESAAERFGKVDCIEFFQPSAVALLSKKSLSPKAVEEAVRLAKKGTLVTRATAIKLVGKHTPAGELNREDREPLYIARGMLRRATRIGAELPDQERLELAQGAEDMARELRGEIAPLAPRARKRREDHPEPALAASDRPRRTRRRGMAVA